MTSKSAFHGYKVAAVVAVFFLAVASCWGQQLTGTLSGTVMDTTGAVVPNATVTMVNEASGDTRSTASNSTGYFSITAVQPGTYTVTIGGAGFKSWKEPGVTFAQGDSKTLPNIKLTVGSTTEVMEIMEGADAVVPDTGEVSTTLNTRMVQDLAIQGRDAGEFLKLMPGMAFNNGLTQGSSFNTKTVGTNNGPIGAFSANGTQPNGAMAYMLDGANLLDPGNMGTQIANINQDMTSEVKVLMSSYTAEYAKGPVVFQAFSKSGGNHFHGEGYLYARNSDLDSEDAFTKSQKGTKPSEHFYYLGGNVGGPIIKNKLFFWGGYEYMNQHPAAFPVLYNVPSPAQLSGDFSNTGVPAGAISAWKGLYNNVGLQNLPAGATNTNIPTTDFDPNIGGILKIYPKPNITPSSNNGWNNYQYINTNPQNRWEATGKVDYAISENTKLTGSYTRQIENDQHPVAVWWAPNWTIPYPSPVVAKTTSNEIMANLTHVFSPTTTNEFVFTYARYINPSTLTNPAAADRTKLGFNVQGLFGHTAKQIPNFLAPWGGVFPDIRQFSFDGGFQGSAFGGIKKDPALYDNFTKVYRTHTIKAGFYWDTNENVQSDSNNDNGIFNVSGGSLTTGNIVADLELGRASNYQQASAVPVVDIKFHQWALYAQDSYKANSQLTLTYGVRFDHVGQWYGTKPGFQVWDPASYDNSSSAGPNTGLLWHALNSRIPTSGWESPTFYIEPRVGLAYDLFGTGKTVLRGGFAVFRYQVSTQASSAAGGPLGAFTYTTGAITSGYAQASTFTPPSSVSQNGADIFALQQGDNRTPRTIDWNLTVSQALPWRSVLEVSYVANKSNNEWINGKNDNVNNINNTIPGSLFLPDVKKGNLSTSSSPLSCGNSDPGKDALDCSAHSANYLAGFNSSDFRPLANYGNMYILTHGAYANYNSLQISWQKQSGPITFLTNYTFSKVLGIRDGSSDNGAGNGKAVDPFVLKNNYGPLAYDHTHILNLSYVWNLPRFVHGNHVMEGAVNGWQFSGYTTYQAGAPLQPGTNGNLNAAFAGGLTYPTNGAPDLPDNTILLPNGLRANAINPSSWLGSSAYTVLTPTITCDPRNHASGAYFNPKCFGMPAYGQQGANVWPYLRGPGYFDSDLGLFKNFRISENQKLQFRVSATNFLNRPNPQFNLAGNNETSLNFTNNYNVLIDAAKTGSNGNECAFLGATVTGGSCSVSVTGISATNTNTSLTGKPKFKTGNRQMTFTVKYYF